MSFLSQLLEHYHLTIKDLGMRKLPGSFDKFKTPFENPSFLNVVKRIQSAIDNHQKTVIYGDYDVDGITSTAIMKRVLDELGLCPGYFIPSRYNEGYGLNPNRVKEFKDKGYQLIIAVDNGVAAFEAISLAKSLEMDVVIIDHHELSDKLPDTEYLFHQTESGFLDYNCSAASLCFFVSSFLRKRFDEYDSVLAGLAVFSDVMPLVGNNLNMAKLLYQYLSTNRYPNLLSFLPSNDFSYDDISFSLIPALNAPGRVSQDVLATNHVCAFLLETKKTERMARLYNEINNFNNQKKSIVQSMTFNSEFDSSHSYITICDSYSGLTGLFANRLLKDKNKPVCVFGISDTDRDILVGSIRVPDGYNAIEIITKFKNLIIQSGGHPKACGLSILKKDYFKVATLFAMECEKHSLCVEEKHDEIPIVIEDVVKENFDILDSFLPFGEGFEKPRFVLTVSRDEIVPSKNGNAVFVKATSNHGRVCAFVPYANLINTTAESFDFYGYFKKGIFNDKVQYDFIADRILPNE